MPPGNNNYDAASPINSILLLVKSLSSLDHRQRTETGNFFGDARFVNDVDHVIDIFVSEWRFFGQPPLRTAIDDDPLGRKIFPQKSGARLSAGARPRHPSTRSSGRERLLAPGAHRRPFPYCRE